MGEPILIFCLAIAGTLSYAYIRQLMFNKRQRQLQQENIRGNRRSVLVVSGRTNGNTNANSNNQAIPPKYEDVVDIRESPPNYDQAVLNI